MEEAIRPMKQATGLSLRQCPTYLGRYRDLDNAVTFDFSSMLPCVRVVGGLGRGTYKLVEDNISFIPLWSLF